MTHFELIKVLNGLYHHGIYIYTYVFPRAKQICHCTKFAVTDDTGCCQRQHAVALVITKLATSQFSDFRVPWYNVIKWKHFPRYWSFVREIQWSPVNSPHYGQLRGALVFSLICAWINNWVNTHEADDLRRHRAHYDVTVIRVLVPGNQRKL